MNKLKLLVAPLLVLPFAIGCNNAKPNPCYVNQSEYEHAISLEGVEFLQVEQVNKKNKKTINEFSPTVYHMKSENTGVDKYIVKDGNVYNKYSRVNDGEWKYTPNVDAHEFLTPQTHDEISPKRYLDALGVVYGQNLNYDASKGIYLARIEVEGATIEVEVGFYNKKIISLEYSFSETDGDRYTYAYKNKTPDLPVL